MQRSQDPAQLCADRELVSRLKRNPRYRSLIRALGDESVYTLDGRLIVARVARKLRCRAEHVASLMADARCVLLAAGGGR